MTPEQKKINGDRLRAYAKKPGEGGRPVGSRNRLQAGFMHALADDFAKYGKGAIEHARRIDPMGYVKTIAALMPKQFEQTTPLEELSDSELIGAIALIRSKLSIGVGEGIRETQEPQSADRLPALPEATGVPPRRSRLPRAVVDGGQPAGKDAGRRHGNRDAPDRPVSGKMAGPTLGPASGGLGRGGHGRIDAG